MGKEETMGNLLASSAFGKITTLDILQFDAVDIDNWSFKLFSKVSVAIFLLSSLLVISTTHFGTPITCDNKDKFIETYCWLHGSYNIKVNATKKFLGYTCIRDPRHPQRTQESLERDTEYYQWVVFMLFIHGALFIIPNKLWQCFEGGLLEQFGNKKEKTKMTITDHDKMQETAKKHADFFKSLTTKKNNEYFFFFLLCELLNVIILVANYYLINAFLGGRFSTYGADVVAFSMKDPDVYPGEIFDPMCDAFPTIVNCVTHDFGTDGKIQSKSVLCILGQNIINEKIYLFLWFWFVIMYLVSIATFIYYIFIFAWPRFRRGELLYHTRTKCKRRGVDDLKHNWNNLSTIGSWFILCQIGKNSNAYFFRQFLSNLT